jgi:hypothetical protein
LHRADVNVTEHLGRTDTVLLYNVEGTMMLRFASVVCVAAAIASSPALAQTTKPPTPAQAAQQQRMASCNADASQRNLKGDARQSYMTACLGGKMNQNTLMKVCNGQATQDKLTSDARKTYLSTCLKKPS